jgi:hypothetical protein
MIAFEVLTWRAAVVGRWTARILGTLSVLFFLALVVGEGPPNPFSLAWRENLSLLCMMLLFGGLAVAWRWEVWGGALSLAGYAGFALLNLNHLRMPAIQIPAAIGCLHLICGLRLHRAAPAGAAFTLGRGVVTAGCATLGVFLLLCTNEIFGNPPLMTPPLHSGADLTGTWSAPDRTLTVARDGAVTGVVAGRLTRNRTWFGRLMGWRTDYLIQDGNVRVPVGIRNSEMWLWVAAERRTLRLRHIQ